MARTIDNWKSVQVTLPGDSPALAAGQVNLLAVEPALRLLPGAMDTPEARVMLLMLLGGAAATLGAGITWFATHTITVGPKG